MTAMRIFLILVLAGLVPGAALAQSPATDVTYCRQLAALYVHYIGRSEAGPYDDVRRGSLDNQVAASQCATQTASAIPVLERVLLNNRFSLPPRG
jgi:hypothetical protein